MEDAVTESVEILEEAYRDNRGDWSCWYRVCAEHGWKHKEWSCPWPECATGSHYPFEATYILASGVDVEADNIWESEHIHMAEAYDDGAGKRWRWVDLSRSGLIDTEH